MWNVDIVLSVRQPDCTPDPSNGFQILCRMPIHTIQDTYIDATCFRGWNLSFTDWKFDEYKVCYGPDTTSNIVPNLLPTIGL